MYPVEIIFCQPQLIDEEQYYLSRSVSVWDGFLTIAETVNMGDAIEINEDFKRLVKSVATCDHWYAIMVEWIYDPYTMDNNSAMEACFTYPNGITVWFESRDDALMFKLTHRPTHA